MAEEIADTIEHKGLKKGLYLLPSSFTAANIGMGFLAVISAVKGFQLLLSAPEQATQYFDYGAKAIGLAIVFDTLDGRVARLTKTSTEIGIQLDSLADVLTFGIAPTILAFCWAIGSVFTEQSQTYGLGIFILFMYVLCGAFRLARFNLQAVRPRVLIEGTANVDKKNFVGLPIPAAAGLVASIIHFIPAPLSSYQEYSDIYAVLVIILMAVLGFLMISTIKYSSFKSAGTGRSNIYTVLGVAAFVAGVWLFSRYVLLIISVIYVSHGIIWYLSGLLRPSKSVENIQENTNANNI